MSTPSGWDETLEQGEVIRWQGRPDATIVWHLIQYACLVLGLALTGFALVWMLVAVQEGGWKWTFGFLFLFMGIFVMVGLPFGKPYIWSKTWYTLTNKRALISTDLPILGWRVKSYPITAQAPLGIEERHKTSVFFATKKSRNSEGRSILIRIGFDRIDDADHVFSLLREIQSEAT